ncbi:MAG: alpha/beta fold hydrolase [Pseudomonadota bacterium]
MSRTASDTTAGYYQGVPGLGLARWMLGASERLSPSLAVRVADRVFCTPLPLKWMNRPKAWNGWQIERWPFENAGLALYARPADSDAPVALLAHGWGGHAAQMLPLALALEQHGLRPLLLDMPAHGRSAGGASNLPQFARALEYVAQLLVQQGRTLRLVAAHSLGANAAAFAVARGLPAERLALLAPPASPRAYTRYFAQMFGLRETTRAAMQQRVEAREGVLMTQFEPAAVGARVRVPTLLVHDREDRINRFADSQAYADHIAQARLLATQGLGHRKILRDTQVLEEVARFAA